MQENTISMQKDELISNSKNVCKKKSAKYVIDGPGRQNTIKHQFSSFFHLEDKKIYMN